MNIVLEDPWVVDSSNDACLLRTGIQAKGSVPRGWPILYACTPWPEDLREPVAGRI